MRLFVLQEPTDSLEETLLASQPDLSLETDNGNEEDDNPSGLRADSPINQSPDNARAYPFCVFRQQMTLFGQTTINHLNSFCVRKTIVFGEYDTLF